MLQDLWLPPFPLDVKAIFAAAAVIEIVGSKEDGGGIIFVFAVFVAFLVSSTGSVPGVGKEIDLLLTLIMA